MTIISIIGCFLTVLIIEISFVLFEHWKDKQKNGLQ